MQKKTYVLLTVLVLSLTLFLFVLFSNSEKKDISTYQDDSLDISEVKESESDLSFEKYFNFDTPEESDTSNEKFVPRALSEKKEECVIDGQIVTEGTVSSNTTCVKE